MRATLSVSAMVWALVLSVGLGCKPSGPTGTAGAGGSTQQPQTTAVEGSAGGQPGPAGEQASPSGQERPIADSAAGSTTSPVGEQTPAQSDAQSTPPGPARGEPQEGRDQAGLVIKPVDAWLEGVEDRQVISAYNECRQRLAADPKDAIAKLNVVYLLMTVGARKEHVQKGSGGALLTQAAKEAREVLAWKDVELPDGMPRLLATVFYNEACALAIAGKVEEALAALDEAITYGFKDFQLLSEDEDLENLRSVPDFHARMEKWRATAAERAAQHAAEKLAHFESFPFDFQITDLEGKPHSLADYKGKVVVVDIWGTWCPPCRAEIPSFIKLQQQYGEQGFQMIGLNYEGEISDKVAEKVKQFIQENGINYPCALASEEIRDQVPDFQGYPTTLFIDRQGKVRLKLVGLHDYEDLEAVVLALLAEPQP